MLLWDSKGHLNQKAPLAKCQEAAFLPAQLGRISGTKRSLDFTAVGHTHTHPVSFLQGSGSYLIRVTVPALSGVPEPR